MSPQTEYIERAAQRAMFLDNSIAVEQTAPEQNTVWTHSETGDSITVEWTARGVVYAARFTRPVGERVIVVSTVAFTDTRKHRLVSHWFDDMREHARNQKHPVETLPPTPPVSANHMAPDHVANPMHALDVLTGGGTVTQTMRDNARKVLQDALYELDAARNMTARTRADQLLHRLNRIRDGLIVDDRDASHVNWRHRVDTAERRIGKLLDKEDQTV